MTQIIRQLKCTFYVMALAICISGCMCQCGRPTEQHVYLNLPQQILFRASQESSDCSWLIRSDVDTRIKVDVEDVHLKYNFVCAVERLAIYDGPTTVFRRIARLCGTEIGVGWDRVHYYSSSNTLLIVFTTYEELSEASFSLTVRAVNTPFHPSLTTTPKPAREYYNRTPLIAGLTSFFIVFVIIMFGPLAWIHSRLRRSKQRARAARENARLPDNYISVTPETSETLPAPSESPWNSSDPVPLDAHLSLSAPISPLPPSAPIPLSVPSAPPFGGASYRNNDDGEVSFTPRGSNTRGDEPPSYSSLHDGLEVRSPSQNIRRRSGSGESNGDGVGGSDNEEGRDLPPPPSYTDAMIFTNPPAELRFSPT